MNSITLSCVITVDRETDKYNGEIFISDDASRSDKLALCLMAIQQLQKMVDGADFIQQYPWKAGE
jgi:hypothetical protein